MGVAHTYAQPSAVKNVAKSVFTLTTFKADGSILSSSHGVFLDNNGTAMSDWSSFDGAATAVVVDANGKRMEVESIIGASEIYDVVKFRVNGKTTGAPVATTASATGAPIYLVGYGVKKAEVRESTISKVEHFMEKYAYYIFAMDIPENTLSCAVVNTNGQLLGILQSSKYSTDLHCTSANYVADMHSEGLTASDPTFRRTSIPIAIPDNKDQAVIALVLAGQGNDSLKYAKTIDLFIEKYPDLTEGYTTRAQLRSNQGDFAAASSDMETAIKNAQAKDEAHFSYARLIYQKEVYQANMPYADWSLDKALDEVHQAYSTNPQPLYRHLEAQILYTKKEYQQAHDMFIELTRSEIRNPELFYEAAQCKTMLEAPVEERLVLLDSALNLFSKPYPFEAGPYLIARAGLLEQKGEYRCAVADYNQYDTLMVGRLNDNFYYLREQCEVKARQFQQALNDIDQACRLAPQEPLYLAEKASLLIRVNQKEEALKTATQCVALAPDYSDGHLLQGLALVQLGKKKEGIAALEKAKELGNEQAQTLIDKYK
ncbi:MAG: tetratricopeptide repeat protein [Prevotella sp.]|nr:tetratricopeptide repeat protein [Prevotella sp.]